MVSVVEAIGIGAAVGLGGSAFLALYLLRRMRQRREGLQHRGSLRPEFANDRAFNRLAMARREAEVLERQGRDIRSARELIDLAEHEFGLRQFDRAYDLAQSAHDTLVAARRRPAPEPSPAAPPGPRTLPVADPALVALAPRDVPASTASPGTEAAPRLPRNRAESQFQVKLLEGDLATARRDRPQDPATAEAASLLVQAQSSFAKEEYTEAMRFALRGRRRIGVTIETVTAGSHGTVGPAPAAPGTGDPLAAAEEASGSERCPSCGHPNLAGDVFCRGCGRPRAAAACPSCGAPRKSSDAFCARCGASFR